MGAEFHITPHLTLDAGYKTASHHLSGPYATLKYTIGTSKFAWRGGKHSESAITTAPVSYTHLYVYKRQI